MTPLSVFCEDEELRARATELGYTLADEQPEQRLLIFVKGDVQVNVWLSRHGLTVATILTHPRMGRNALYHRRISAEDLDRILRNPRTHIGSDYRNR